MNCINLEQVKTAFNNHELHPKEIYYSKIFKIFNPNNITLQYIINKCKNDKTIVYTKNYYSGKIYCIVKLLQKKYYDYKYFTKQHDFTHYEENVLNLLNNNLITPKISGPRYFDELPKTLLEKRKIDNDNMGRSQKRKIDNDNMGRSQKLKIITDVNENVSENKKTINICFKNSKIITNEKIKEIYNLVTDENEIYINDLLIGNINNDGNLQFSDTIIKKYKKLEFNVDDE